MHRDVEVAILRIVRGNDGLKVGVLVVTRVIVERLHLNAAIAKLVGDGVNNRPRTLDLIQDANSTRHMLAVTGRYDDPLEGNRDRAARGKREKDLYRIIGNQTKRFHDPGRDISDWSLTVERAIT